VVGYVGRLHSIKGVDLLGTAFRRISKKLSNVRLLIVGGGEQEKSLRSTLSAEISSGIVHIQPSMAQEQLPSWYRAMDIIVMPSRYETMSNSVLEAMACGIPFLASDVGGNKMLVRSGGGWLFESESDSSLSCCLRSAINNPAEMRARGQIGLSYVQQRHGWAKSAERLDTIINSRLGVGK
jgi:glycosyltransferase involved in cell wall biosynthesis